MLLLTIKVVFISFLLLMFFKLFGIESVNKFLAKQTFILESSRDYTKADHPAITVCATANGLNGWKSGSKEEEFHKICNSSADAREG